MYTFILVSKINISNNIEGLKIRPTKNQTKTKKVKTKMPPIEALSIHQYKSLSRSILRLLAIMVLGASIIFSSIAGSLDSSFITAAEVRPHSAPAAQPPPQVFGVFNDSFNRLAAGEGIYEFTAPGEAPMPPPVKRMAPASFEQTSGELAAGTAKTTANGHILLNTTRALTWVYSL